MPRIVDSEERRSELGAAAARVIARSGIAGATMREVAAEAGWTTGALTHYFADKQELLRFTLETSLRRRRARRPDRARLSPDEALRVSLLGALPTEAERLIALTDGIAIQALFDPENWSAERQIAALDAGLADATRKETT